MNQSKNQQFAIEKTFELVTLINTHTTYINVDDEETFYQLKQQLDILSCTVPDSIVDQINTFADKHLQPLALAPTTILGKMPTLETFFNYVSSTEGEFQEIVKNTIKPFILGRESCETQTYNKTALQSLKKGRNHSNKQFGRKP